MLINPELIIQNGGIVKAYEKGELIFEEGDSCRFFFQIIKGCVKLYNTSSELREFTQGIFHDGESFGEPPLLINMNYPSSARATKNTTILKLSKAVFLKLLDEDPSLQKKLIHILSSRLYSKSTISKIIINNTPKVRILSFLAYFKSKNSLYLSEEKIIIPFTRQEIANLTGLRVETVIRTLSRLKEEGKVEIIDRKLYY